MPKKRLIFSIKKRDRKSAKTSRKDIVFWTNNVV